jgi:hypothetical protein
MYKIGDRGFFSPANRPDERLHGVVEDVQESFLTTTLVVRVTNSKDKVYHILASIFTKEEMNE